MEQQTNMKSWFRDLFILPVLFGGAVMAWTGEKFITWAYRLQAWSNRVAP